MEFRHLGLDKAAQCNIIGQVKTSKINGFSMTNYASNVIASFLVDTHSETPVCFRLNNFKDTVYMLCVLPTFLHLLSMVQSRHDQSNVKGALVTVRL